MLSALGVSVRSSADGSMVSVKNLLSIEGCTGFCTNVIKNFSGFCAAGRHSGAGAGAGLAERVGLLPR